MALSAQIPTELWGRILEEVDDPFDLWVNCRQVSRTLQKEAEHIFRVLYVPQLCLHWETGLRNVRRTNIQSSLDEKSTSADSSIAYTTTLVIMGAPRNDMEKPRVLAPEEYSQYPLLRTLDYKDIYFHEVTGYFAKEGRNALDEVTRHEFHVSFGGRRIVSSYVNDVNLPKLRVHYGQDESLLLSPENTRLAMSATSYPMFVSFNWKVLISQFFAEEVYIRRRQTGQGFEVQVEQTIRNFMRDSITLLKASPSCPDPPLSNGKAPQHTQPDIPTRVACESEYQVYHEKVNDWLVRQGVETYDLSIHDHAYENRLWRSYEEAGLSSIYQQERGSSKLSALNHEWCVSAHTKALWKIRCKLLLEAARQLWDEEIERLGLLDETSQNE
jgi:hypothetical protein